jgi:hypothetical protein
MSDNMEKIEPKQPPLEELMEGRPLKDRYDFEPQYDIPGYLDTVREGVLFGGLNALCDHCAHGVYIPYLSITVRCLQGSCDTLECIIGRLSDLPLGD